MVTNGRPAMHFLWASWYPEAMEAVWTTDLPMAVNTELDDFFGATVSMWIKPLGPFHYGWIRNERTKVVECFVYVATPWRPIVIFNMKW